MFNAKEQVDKIVKFIRNYYQENNLGGVVIGISGGKDSAVVAGLFTKALGPENVLGVTLPCHSNEEDKIDAKIVSDYYGFRLVNIDLTDSFDTFKKQINLLDNFNEAQLLNSDINIKPRMRMMSLYYMAALESAINNKTYIVAGTSNKCEEYVGYFTKGGDSVSDIKVISDLTVSEVIKIGKELQVPKKVLYKTPHDGLSGMSDEDKLGVKYSDIEKYINNEELSEDIKQKIEKLHNNSRHKFNIPTYIK